MTPSEVTTALVQARRNISYSLTTVAGKPSFNAALLKRIKASMDGCLSLAHVFNALTTGTFTTSILLHSQALVSALPSITPSSIVPLISSIESDITTLKALPSVSPLYRDVHASSNASVIKKTRNTYPLIAEEIIDI